MSASLSDTAQGRWRDILLAVGMDKSFLNPRKNGPCPWCGGRDRYRWTDHEGSGAFYCSHCGTGNGFEIIKRMKRVDYAGAAEIVKSLVGQAEIRKVNRGDTAAKMRKIWHEARPVGNDAVSDYLASRGISATSALRCHPGLIFEGKSYPAMVAKVISPDGTRACQVHRTFILGDGNKARKLCEGDLEQGSAIRLFPEGKTLGIGEGIETCLSSHRIHKIPVWAAINALNLERFYPPDCVEKLVILGDNDSSFTGNASAYLLAKNIVRRSVREKRHIDVSVILPNNQGEDWNDVLLKIQTIGTAVRDETELERTA